MDFTNHGRYLMCDCFFRASTAPINNLTNYPSFYVILVTAFPTPTAATKTMVELTEIAAGNGYTAGGVLINRDNTDFDNLTEDDIQNRSAIQIRDISWTAGGGSIPSSGAGARFAVLATSEATISQRQVIAWWDLNDSITKASGSTLTLENLELRLVETQ